MKRRQRLVRLDDEKRRSTVLKVRVKIFKKGLKVNAAAIERLLESRSLTATEVKIFAYVF
jgi:hypothetical protein